jgi:hypothetical protein
MLTIQSGTEPRDTFHQFPPVWVVGIRMCNNMASKKGVDAILKPVKS